MAAAVATADNRCVGGGGGESPAATARPQQVAPLPSAVVPTLTSGATSPGHRQRPRQRRGGHDPKASHSSASSYSSSPPPSSSEDDDEEDGDGGGGVAAFGGRGVVAVKSPSVAVKRLKDLQQHLVDLDDLELLDRHLTIVGEAPDPSAADSDTAAELRQKNKDLVLAARLGKALLAKNDELSLMNERLAEEYGDKLEVRVFSCCVCFCSYRSHACEPVLSTASHPLPHQPPVACARGLSRSGRFSDPLAAVKG